MARALATSLVQSLRVQAEVSPDKAAYTYLADGDNDARSLTYGQLDSRARAVAAELRGRAKPGDRALLLFPPGLEFVEAFFGCLYAGVIAIPAASPDPHAPQRVLSRVNAIVADCEPAVVLCSAETGKGRRLLTQQVPWLARTPVLLPPGPGGCATDWLPARAGPGDPAFLQYTSGSTGTPKGVLLTHGNVLHNLTTLRSALPQSTDSVLVSWLPLFHDMGLIGVVLYTAFLGARCVLIAPEHFLRRPARWLEAVSRYKGTFTGAPNFGFELCLRRMTPADRAGLDLSGVEVMFNGAEPVRPDTLDRFARTFAECGLRPRAISPCYGLAEATLLVSTSPWSARPRATRFDAAALEAGSAAPVDAGGRSLVSSGPVAGDQTLLIVDPDTRRPRPSGRTGEIWVAGPSVGAGYWHRSRESTAVFEAEPSPPDGRGYLRTGDLGFLFNGELYVAGRIKDLLIVRGRNLAPQDVERSVEGAHPGLRSGCGAVFQLDEDPAAALQQPVVAVQEFDPASGEDADGAIRAIRAAVTRDFEIELDSVVLVSPRTIPKTSSGKIQRRACRRGYGEGRLSVVARWQAPAVPERGELVERVRGYLAALLGVGADQTQGVDSLRAAQIRAALERDLGVRVPLSGLLRATSLDGLATRVAASVADDPSPDVPAGTATEFPLSDGQLALWYLHEWEPDSRAYHVPVAVRVGQPLDLTALRRALEILVGRHEALRTRFAHRGGTPYQQVLDHRPLDLRVADAASWSAATLAAAMAEEADRPFDLGDDPLLRIRVYRVAPDDHHVLLVFHHIVTDFWSLAWFTEELGRVYAALVDGRPADLAPVPRRYADFVSWQRRWLATGEARAQLDAWAATLTPEPAPLELPTSRPRPPVRTTSGGSVYRRLPDGLAAEARALAARHGATLYTLLLTVFQALLHRYTGQDDMVIGSPAAGRERSEFERVFGFFVNTLAIRLDTSGDPRFDELLARTRAAVHAALDRQAVPFVRVVERVQPRRDSSRSPLFQAMYVHQKSPLAAAELAGLAELALGEGTGRVVAGALTLESVRLEQRHAQFDLTLITAEVDGRLGLSLRYNTDLFDDDTARRLLGHFETLLAGAVAGPDRRLSTLPPLGDGEADQLDTWNATGPAHSGMSWLPAEFAAQAARSPDAAALVFEDATVTYAELDRGSNQLARHLRRHGVERGGLVGVAVPRSPELVVGILGILKAGAAYLPLDPEYPADRLATMLDDARPDVVLTTSGQLDTLPETRSGYLCLDTGWDEVATEDGAPFTTTVDGQDAAYVIYTSGSTGRPKGVVNTHSAIRNRLGWMRDHLGCRQGDRYLQKTPAGFDVSVWEFFLPLTTGATLVLARPGGHRDAAYLVDVIERQRITVVHFVPSLVRAFLSEAGPGRCGSLRVVVCSGEALPADLARALLARFDCELYNLYGPTEAAVDVTAWRCRPDDPRAFVPIGHPISGVTVHLLDRHGNRVPVGVPGELYIGGVAPARGYLNQPGLTAERFVPDPYADEPGARLYRTGDLAHRHVDGGIEFLGRLDSQVKIYGNRVEPGEIESCLAGHPAVREAAVVAYGEHTDVRLAAHVVAAAGRAADPARLRRFLAGRLPAHLVPARIAVVAALPRTPSGKVDRRVLAEPDRGATGSTAGFVPPRTAEEQTLARILAGVLGIDEVGVQDNFFTLGGDSIRALQVRVLAREGGLDLSIDDLLRFQTVAGLARAARPTASPATATRLAGGPFALLGDADRARLPAGVVDAYPLTRLQAGLVFHSEGSPDYETYVMDFHVGGSFAEPALREALARLVRRHPLLRTSFDLTGFSESVQLVHETATVPLTVHDLTGGSAAEQDAAVDRLMREQRWLKFDWTRAPLLRVDVLVGSDRSFHCTFSHPFFDGWSMALLVTELLTTYTALAHGEDPATAPPPLNYAEFVALEREAVGSAEQRQFWADYLAGGSGGRLPRSPSQRRVAPSRHRRLTVQIDSGIRDGLRSLAASVGSPLKSVLLAAHLRVVSVLTGRTDVTTGVIANGRPEELDGDRTIGVFLNTVPLRTRLTGGTWRDLVRQALAAEREVLPYRRYPLAELVRTVGHGEQLFDTAFNYIHFHLYEVLRHTPGLELLGWRNPADQTYFPLTAYLHLDVSTGELQCFIDVDEAVLTPAQVAAVLAYYRATLEDMATNPDGRYEAHSPLQPAQRRQLAEWNRTGLAWPADRPAGVHRRVALQASRRGAATAVHCAGVRLSYVELERRANQLAHRLRRMGAGAGTTVGVALDRSADLPVAILAVLKTGAAYVPLDPAYPGERLRHMLLDSGARIVVTESSLVDRVPSTGAHPLLLDRERPALAAQPASAPEVTFDPEALAYVIYTSGSTGVPKGVEVPHRALDNVLLAFEDRLGWSADEALLAVTTLSFDIAGLELLLPLTTGARLELATRAEAADPHLLMARLDTGAVSTMQATPATWRMLLDAGWSGHPALRLLCGGEALTASLAERLLPCCRELWNVYGPTETTIWSTAARVEEVNGAPPIGRPLANTTCHVLDGYGQPVPVGAPGELYLGGLGLARGYRGDPALTRAVFVCDPFRTGDRTARLYGTGDLVRWRPDGMLEFLGRLDSQVKVRGFRIELGEVEAALARHPEIRDSAARARTDDESGEAELIAYVVPRPGCEVNVAELRGALAGDLPSFMVPSTFVVLDELPRTANGKLDRGALPAPPTRRPNLATAFAGPRTELERRVAGIWQEFLGVGRVGIDDRFFELGGHSLLLVRVHARMRELIAADVPLTALLAHPTVRSVAAFLEEPDRGTRPAVPAQPEIRDRQALVSRLRTRRPRSAE